MGKNRAISKDYVVNPNVIQFKSINHYEGVIEVRYSVFPYYFSRVQVYDEREFIQWIMDTHRTDDHTFSIDFFMEEFTKIMETEIIEFHYKQVCGGWLADVRRLENIIDSLIRRLERLSLRNLNLINKLK